MITYLQPSFYRFSEDSLELASIASEYSLLNEPKSVLDICAGCGVVGIESANKLLSVEQLDFIDAQEDFLSYQKENCQNLLRPKIQTKHYFTKISDYKPEKRYDLIVVNPPYYSKSKSRPSSDRQRNICRQFILDGIDELINLIELCLSETGSAFILNVPDQFQIKKEYKDIKVQNIYTLGKKEIIHFVYKVK